jgi:DNA-binding transcriptional MerR regulator
MRNTEQLTVGELARSAGVPPRTIRFYEAKGILPTPGRSRSGYRLYGPDDLKRLSLARRARSLGFSLGEVRGLLGLAQHERCGSFQGKAAQLLLAKLAEVDEAIQRLHDTRRELQESLANFNGGDCHQACFECGCDCLGLGA